MARFVHEVPMRWSDMDAYRHVNNTAYFAYLEQARVAMFYFHSEGFTATTVISRNEVDYLRPIVYHPQPLRLEVWISDVGGAHFTAKYEIYDQLPSGAVLAARAATTCVTYDFATNRPRRLTSEERAILAGFGDE